MGADINAAYEEWSNDTALMKRARKDIKFYLSTISTNIVSIKVLRVKLIERLDKSLERARNDGYDDKLINAYEFIENMLLKDSLLQHKILSSDLLNIARRTQKDIHTDTGADKIELKESIDYFKNDKKDWEKRWKKREEEFEKRLLEIQEKSERRLLEEQEKSRRESKELEERLEKKFMHQLDEQNEKFKEALLDPNVLAGISSVLNAHLKTRSLTQEERDKKSFDAYKAMQQREEKQEKKENISNKEENELSEEDNNNRNTKKTGFS